MEIIDLMSQNNHDNRLSNMTFKHKIRKESFLKSGTI